VVSSDGIYYVGQIPNNGGSVKIIDKKSLL